MTEQAVNTVPIVDAAAMMSLPLLSQLQVSQLLGIEEQTVGTLHRVGKLRGVCVGKSLRWKPGWVQVYVDGLEQETPP